MLEKIGLPAKPSLRGHNWVVDASHCQGCSSQFTFINRKHHCRRCGGLFCNSCTQQRMVLRGQGDSPVRICEPCKKLEEAARFEMRYGHRNRTARGSSKLTSKYEDEILNQLLGNDGNESSSSAQQPNTDLDFTFQRTSSSASCSTPQEVSALGGGEILRSHSVNVPNNVHDEIRSTSPEKIRQQALEEKKWYKILKGEGKSEEALKAFKRGKELEKKADALELSIRKNRRKVLHASNMAETQNKDGSKDGPKESFTKPKPLSQAGKEKDDLTAELRALGWTDTDPYNEDKRPVNMSLEGELSSLLGDISQRTYKIAGTSGIDKSQAVAHKRKALTLKRQGNLAEAKEELKKAKVLEKKIEQQELMGVAEDSDDEISALIRTMGSDKQDELLVGGYEQGDDFDFNQLMGTSDDIGDDKNLEVTDDDLADPELAATLKSLGWTDDDIQQNNAVHSFPIGREGLLSEIHSLKKEALNHKRAGNIAEVMALLKKAKLLEKDLESLEGEADNLITQNPTIIQKDSTSQIIHAKKDVDSKPAPKNRLMIQKELLALKKKALALRREGRLDEAEEELKKGRVLELQLEEMDNTSKTKATPVNIGSKGPELAFEHPDIHGIMPTEEGEEDVTDQDLNDPTYLSLLKNLGWKDEANEFASSLLKPNKENVSHSIQIDEPLVAHASSGISSRTSGRSRSEIQRELLGLKRKALALRREGRTDEAEEVLIAAKALGTQMEELDAPKKEIQVESNSSKDDINRPPLETDVEEEDTDNVTEKDMNDPALHSMLKNLRWKNEEIEPVAAPGKLSKNVSVSSGHSINPSVIPSSSSISVAAPSTKGEIQQDPFGFLTNARTNQDHRFIPPSHQSGNTMDLMTGDAWGGSQTPAEKPEAKISFDFDVSFMPKAHVQVESLTISPDNLRSKEDIFSSGSNISHQAEGSVDLGSLTGSPESLRSEVNVTTKKREATVNTDEKQLSYEINYTQKLTSQNNKNDIQQEVLARKRKAVALKREGKLLEAREELRQAKLLEKSLEMQTSEAKTGTHNVSTSVSNVESNASPVHQKEASASNLASKPLPGRDRFKLQQESLSHKRQALKLRREGRLEEAEVEFELAKALEAQLEEAASQDSGKSNVSMVEPGDDALVEDLLDPQLLSALKAVGIADVSPERPGLVKLNPPKGENVIQDRIKLEEQIKAEKVKAVNLKWSGKQAEALQALRRAKLFEKKLNSLASN